MAESEKENWDEDLDFQGEFFTHSVSTIHTNFSSRLSMHSESNAADEDWNIMLAPNDDASTISAIQSAKQAGIPIPQNVPSSALLGGTIKRLGKNNGQARAKVSKINVEDDWADDLQITQPGPLVLKTAKLERPSSSSAAAATLSSFADDDFGEDFDDFTDGSLGIRLAGTRRETRNRSSSASALTMSPSLGSATVESEDDDFRGLEIPEGPVDLAALLKKRQTVEASAPAPAAAPPPTSNPQPPPPPSFGPVFKLAQPTAKNNFKPAVLSDDNDDFLNDIDIGGGEIFDPTKLTLNRNIKQKNTKTSIPAPARLPMTTLTFSDKPSATTRIPRLAGATTAASKNPSRLEPVFESGATHVTRQRQQPSASTSNFLRAKRSMPVLRGPHPPPSKPHVPFIPAGVSTSQSQHVSSKPPSYTTAYHLRQNSDPHRSQSPPLRSYSRLSSGYVPDTPSRNARRADLAPSSLAREAAAKRTVTKPTRRRNFGDGTELDLFDDLPTSTVKESKFLKQPSARAAPKSLRNIPNKLDTNAASSKIPFPERMQTPAPATPRSPTRHFRDQSNTPRYLRDTAASRIARETRLRNAPSTRPRSENGPILPLTTNWKAQIAARSPHVSPTAQRNKAKRITPNFIPPNAAQTGKPMTEKGMVFNPSTLRWEGNENSLAPFDFPPPLHTPTSSSHAQATSYLSHQPSTQPAQTISPPRPALITPLASDYSNQNIKVVGGMVFDPRRMCWLKLRPGEGGKNSPSVTEDEEDPFAGLEDLKDGPTGASSTAGDRPNAGGLASDEWLVGEEFDLGPEFIRRQRDEEVAWRRKCDAWFPAEGIPRHDDGAWRWSIREIAGQMT
ncbi:hypothetical protein AAFC00_001358 [Neodothiora populina]|uniref:Cytokinesis regulator n=1 Tax=Neodothiora populina TaxID=2781224 RepID=A0ABR3PNW8_9PEZI